MALFNPLRVLVMLTADVVELFERMDFFAAKAGFFGQREDAIRNEVELALAELHFGAAVFDARFQLGEALALGGHDGQVLGCDRFGQAHGAETRLPVGKRGGVFFFGLFEAAISGRNGLFDFAVLAFDGHHAFEFGEMALGVLEAEADGAAAEFEGMIELGLFGFERVDFFQERIDLVVAGVEAVGGGSFREELDHGGDDRSADAAEGDPTAVAAGEAGGEEPPRGDGHDAEDEQDAEEDEELDGNDLLVDEVFGLLLHGLGFAVGGCDFLFECLPLTELRYEVAGSFDIDGQAEFFAVGGGGLDLRAHFVLARLVVLEFVLSFLDELGGGFDGARLGRELFDEVARKARRELAGAGPFVSEAIVLAFEAGFKVFYFVGEFGGLAFDALKPILLFEKRFEAFAAADKLVVDAQALGFVAQLVALAALDVALAFVLFDAFGEVVERFECSFVERAEIGEAFELIVDFAALDPEGLDADRDFEPARGRRYLWLRLVWRRLLRRVRGVSPRIGSSGGPW